MSRGLGSLQRDIKNIFQYCADDGIGALTFADIRAVALHREGVSREDLKNYRFKPAFERSMKRALKTLVDRREVVIVGGKGGQLDPYRYTTLKAIWAPKRRRKR